MPILIWIFAGLGSVGAGYGGYKLYQKYKKRRAEYGTGAERRLERKTGLGKLSRTFGSLERRSSKDEREDKNIEDELDRTSKKRKKQSESKYGREINEAAEKDAGAAESEKEVEKASGTLGGRSVGMIASIKAVTSSIANYLTRVRPITQRQEQDLQALENLMKGLNNIGNFSRSDSRVTAYLNGVFMGVSAIIKRGVEYENEKETYRQDLVNELVNVFREARGIIIASKTALNMFQTAKRGVGKNFRQELEDVSASIKDKSKPREEIVFLQQHYGLLVQLNRKLQTTYRVMDKAAREIRKILRSISRKEAQVGRHERKANSRERTAKRKYISLDKFATEFENSIKSSTDPYGAAIGFPSKVNEFYNEYKEIINADLEFDEDVKNVLLLQITITLWMEAYERWSTSLDQAENAVEQDLAKSTELIADIVKGQDQKSNLKELTQNIRKAGGEIDYEIRVKRFLEQLTRSLERSERNVNSRFRVLLDGDKRIIGEIDRLYQEKNHWNEQTGTFEQIRHSGGFAFYVKSLPNLAKAFKADRYCRCIDEGTENGIRAAGSGIAYVKTEGLDKGFIGYNAIQSGINAAAEAFRNAPLLGIYSHEECGAAKLVYGLLPDVFKGQLKMDHKIESSDEFGDYFAKELAKKLRKRYKGQIHIGHMSRPSGHHITRYTYIDGTGVFNPAAIKGLPNGFVISRKYLGAKETEVEADVSISISTGDHGFGAKITPNQPHVLVAIGNPKIRGLSVQMLKREMQPLVAKYGGKVIVDGFTAPMKAIA
jgi:hypothetical protein